MAKQGKKYLAAKEKIEPNKKHTLEEAVAKVKEVAFAKFDETVELTMWLITHHSPLTTKSYG